MRGIAGHIEQAERGVIRKSPKAHKHFFPLLPTAMVLVIYGFVLAHVQVQSAAHRLPQEWLSGSEWGFWSRGGATFHSSVR